MTEPTGLLRLFAERPSSVTLRRMDAIIGRSYSAALLFSLIEIITNALHQAKYLHLVPFLIILGLNVGSVLAMAIGNWVSDVRNVWYVLHAGVVVASLVAWPILPLDATALPDQFTPFIWWTMGWGAMSAGLGFNRILAAFYILLIPAWFAVIETQPAGGNATLGIAAQNAIYTLLISAVLVTLIALLRWRAIQQDQAAEEAAQAAANNAATEANERERLRLNSVVHNQVLTAINAAIEAHSPQQQQAAAAMAVAAIDRLNNYEAEDEDPDNQIPASVFFDALTSLIQKQSARIGISVAVEGGLELPFAVVNALNEATLQAVNNSLLHAGPASVARRVVLKATQSSVKIAVIDEGKGFRPSRIPRNRIGIRTMIRRRLQQVGGEAHVNSKPGEGTTVVLEWGPND